MVAVLSLLRLASLWEFIKELILRQADQPAQSDHSCADDSAVVIKICDFFTCICREFRISECQKSSNILVQFGQTFISFPASNLKFCSIFIGLSFSTISTLQNCYQLLFKVLVVVRSVSHNTCDAFPVNAPFIKASLSRSFQRLYDAQFWKCAHHDHDSQEVVPSNFCSFIRRCFLVLLVL